MLPSLTVLYLFVYWSIWRFFHVVREPCGVCLPQDRGHKHLECIPSSQVADPLQPCWNTFLKCQQRWCRQDWILEAWQQFKALPLRTQIWGQARTRMKSHCWKKSRTLEAYCLMILFSPIMNKRKRKRELPTHYMRLASKMTQRHWRECWNELWPMMRSWTLTLMAG